jgi:hypothetical protein
MKVKPPATEEGEREAAAILAALPPDWCGHEAIVRAHIRTGSAMGVEIAEQAATIATLRAALDGLMEATDD